MRDLSRPCRPCMSRCCFFIEIFILAERRARKPHPCRAPNGTLSTGSRGVWLAKHAIAFVCMIWTRRQSHRSKIYAGCVCTLEAGLYGPMADSELIQRLDNSLSYNRWRLCRGSRYREKALMGTEGLGCCNISRSTTGLTLR